MKALLVLGSRNPQGQTARAAQALLQGLAEGGGDGEVLFLPQLQVERCRQCEDSGWGTCRSEGQCVIDDDLHTVVDRLRAVDAAAFVTPVYFGDLSESMKAFTDRLRRICRHAGGRQGIEGKPAVVVCVAGGGGGGAPTCTVNLERVLRTSGFDVVDVVPARRQNLEMKQHVLQVTGRWFAGLPSSDGR
jgi:multimeric flavodoxin WrbA